MCTHFSAWSHRPRVTRGKRQRRRKTASGCRNGLMTILTVCEHTTINILRYHPVSVCIYIRQKQTENPENIRIQHKKNKCSIYIKNRKCKMKCASP